MMEQRLTIITLGVSNLEKSTRFYETKFGWKKSKDSNAHISFFNLNGILLSLYEKKELAKDAQVNPEGKGFKQFTLACNTRSKEEVNQLITELKAMGVEIAKEPQKTDWGGYSGYVSDLDGNLWEIAFNPYLALDESGNAIPN